jgi:cation diffusion facilitator family transporter
MQGLIFASAKFHLSIILDIPIPVCHTIVVTKLPHTDSEEQAHTKHGHTHGTVDASLFTTERGIWAVKWSFFWLLLTALFQIVIVYFTGSVALLADTIHNFGDAATAIPLWAAFTLAKRKTTKTFTYGYGRVEDLAGVAVVLTILFSAIVAGYQSFDRLIHPQKIGYLWAVALASIIGFLGNEAVALFRINVGKAIGSAALIADGYHARVDGLTSLAVLGGAIGVWLGFPLADPIIGMLITIAILWIVWDSGKSVFRRLLDGVDPEVIDEIKHAANHVKAVRDVSEIRVRWLGHRLHAEINVAVDAQLSVAQGHEIAQEVRHRLLHHLKYLSNATIHVDPVSASGEEHHRIANHKHDDLPGHSH